MIDVPELDRQVLRQRHHDLGGFQYLASSTEKAAVGWWEWAALPDFGISPLRVKIDTGARTSALHVHHLLVEDRRDGHWAKFAVSPRRKHRRGAIACEARIRDLRMVKNSSGRQERRAVIATTIVLGSRRWPIEITLADRSRMEFRMILGRSALRIGRLLVDPARSALGGPPTG